MVDFAKGRGKGTVEEAAVGAGTAGTLGVDVDHRPRSRFFAANNTTLANGSFWRVIYEPAYARGAALYVEGRCIGTSLLATAACDALCESLPGYGLREYLPSEIIRLTEKAASAADRLRLSVAGKRGGKQHRRGAIATDVPPSRSLSI
jgi:hypothetical protein